MRHILGRSLRWVRSLRIHRSACMAIVLFLFAAVFSRITVFSNIAPFGFAFFVAVWMVVKKPYLPYLGVILGSLFGSYVQLPAICATSLSLCFMWLWKRRKKYVRKYEFLIISAIAQLLVLPIFYLSSVRAFMFGIIWIAISVSSAIVMQKALRALTYLQGSKIMTDGELLCVGYLFGVSLMGFTDLSVWGFSVPIMLAVLGVYLFAYAKGFFSIALSVVFGIFLLLANHVSLIFVANLAICTFVAAIFSRLGRLGVGLGFCVCNFLFGSYIGGNLANTILPQNYIPALILFLLIPKRTMQSFRCHVDSASLDEDRARTALNGICAQKAHQITCAANAFHEVSTVFNQEYDAPETANNDRQFNSQRMFLHLQMRGLCDVLHGLAEEMKHDSFPDVHLAQMLRKRLTSIFPTGNVSVFTNSNRICVDVCVKCTENKIPNVINVIENTLSRSFRLINMREEAPYMHLQLEENARLRCTYGTASQPKSGLVSGDSFGVRQLINAKALFALSDGMGTGVQAKKESKKTLQLLFQLYDAGFPGETALPCVNHILKHQSNEEIYATLDLLYLNLDNGMGQFIKFGAPPSYILRNGKIITVYSEALPAGIVEEAKPAVNTMQLEKNDIIVLMTDGVSDTFADSLRNELLICAGGANTCADAAKALIDSAMSRNPRDDMSVMVIRMD